MTDWSFLTNHGKILVALVGMPGASLREIADAAGTTERTAHRIVCDLEEAGYVKRHRLASRNFYEIGLEAPEPLNGRHREHEMAHVLGALLATQLRDGQPPRR